MWRQTPWFEYRSHAVTWSAAKFRVDAVHPLSHNVRTACHRVILLGFLLILVFGPVFYGAVEEWQVSVLSFVSILMFISWVVSNLASGEGRLSRGKASRLSFIVYGLPVLFIILVICQMAPVSDGLLGLLSPARNALDRLTGAQGNTPVSVAPHTTKLWLFRTVAYTLVFIVAANAFTSRRQILYILAAIIVLGYVLALYGILQYLSAYSLPSLFDRRFSFGRVVGTYVNPNHFAGYLAMCVPLALSAVFIRKSGMGSSRSRLGRRIINFFSEKLQDRRFLLPLTAIVVMSLAIVFTMSRMGIFAFAVSLILFALLLGSVYRKRLRVAVLGSIIVAILAVSYWFGLDPVLERYSLLSGDSIGRIEAWKMTGKVIGDYPVLGTGLGTFIHVSPGYQTQATKFGHWGQSHNDFLNLLSDTGIAGFAIGMGFLIAWYMYVFRLLSSRRLKTYQRSIAVGCITGVSAIIIHSVADFNLQIPANAFYLAALLGLAISVLRIEEIPSNARGEGEKAGRGKSTGLDPGGRLIASAGKIPVRQDSGVAQPLFIKPLRGTGALKSYPISGTQALGRRRALGKAALCIVAVLLGALLVPVIARSTWADYKFQKCGNAKNPESAIQCIQEGIALDHDNPELHYRLGMAEYWDKLDYEKARNSFAQAVCLTPSEAKYHYRLGMAHARLGEENLAEKEFSLAMKFAPMHPDLHYKIGFYHFHKWRRTGDMKSLAGALSELRISAEINSAYLGKSLEMLGMYLPQYENLQNLVPDTPEHRRGFARYLAGRDRWAEALKEYRRVWRLRLSEDPSYRGDENLCLASARCYLMTGNVQDARRGYIKAVNIARDRHKAVLAIQRDYQSAGLQRECLALLFDLKGKFPDDHLLDVEIAKLHLALGDYDTAEKQLLEISKTRPSNQVYRHLFYISMRRKDYDLAEVYSERAIRLNPSESIHHAMLARAKRANGDYKGALLAFRQALAIEPENETYAKELEETRRLVASGQQ